MGRGLRGRTVVVLRPTDGGTDPFGEPVEGEPERVKVANVLIDQPTTADIEQTARRFGVSCELTLHFPKSYEASLRGCTVELPAPWERDGGWEVMGDPLPYDPALTPGEHDRPVHVRRVDG